jgi:tRNA-dihydrouridine synthase B
VTVPWTQPCPLLLAPMQGLTNRAFRGVFGRTVKPDMMFTEFVRVRPRAKVPIANNDFVEATSSVPGIPLVVQVIGCADEGVLQATQDLVARGVEHINVNMGCPWGRMTSVLAGGGMFSAPETVAPMLRELRALVPGSLSVKTRAGIDDERQIFDVLPAFEDAGLDFLVVHPRTVEQKYKGAANHALTREIVDAASFAVIANGDVRDQAEAARVLDDTGAAGLMLGRGAVSDPMLFERVRGRAPLRPSGEQRKRELAGHLSLLLEGYREIFHGDAQILSKLKEVLAHVQDPELARWVKGLKKQRRASELAAILAREAPLQGGPEGL